MTCLSAYGTDKFPTVYRQNSEKALLGGGGAIPPPPPLATLVLFLLITKCPIYENKSQRVFVPFLVQNMRWYITFWPLFVEITCFCRRGDCEDLHELLLVKLKCKMKVYMFLYYIVIFFLVFISRLFFLCRPNLLNQFLLFGLFPSAFHYKEDLLGHKNYVT